MPDSSSAALGLSDEVFAAAAVACKPGKTDLSGAKCSKLTGCAVCKPNAKDAKTLECTCCNAGYVLPKGKTACTACKAGEFSLAASATCTKCAAGLTSLKDGSPTCDGELRL